MPRSPQVSGSHSHPSEGTASLLSMAKVALHPSCPFPPARHPPGAARKRGRWLRWAEARVDLDAHSWAPTPLLSQPSRTESFPILLACATGHGHSSLDGTGLEVVMGGKSNHCFLQPTYFIPAHKPVPYIT